MMQPRVEEAGIFYELNTNLELYQTAVTHLDRRVAPCVTERSAMGATCPVLHFVCFSWTLAPTFLTVSCESRQPALPSTKDTLQLDRTGRLT